MRWFIIVLLALTLTGAIVLNASAATQTAEILYKEGAILYVWAAKGLNLRQHPSPSASVIKVLPYGTAITVLNQDEKSVPYDFEFFRRKDTSETLTQISGEQPNVVLRGQWIKVRDAEQEGYVFDKLLLDIAPKNTNEDFKDYLVRVFSLTNHKKEKKQHKNKEHGKYIAVYTTCTSKENSVVLWTQDIDGDATVRGSGGNISIPEFSFEKAFIFFNVIMPALSDHGFKYKSGREFEYLLDPIGNTALLKKTKRGVSFEWFFGMN
ncbi:MAG: SH3 domain-containing protein [Syntrophaceae bacterium]